MNILYIIKNYIELIMFIIKKKDSNDDYMFFHHNYGIMDLPDFCAFKEWPTGWKMFYNGKWIKFTPANFDMFCGDDVSFYDYAEDMEEEK
jgi:hypothetical protein